MKLLGDVSDEHKELARELEELEKYFNGDQLPPEYRARGYVCCAHDWYKMGADEEGNRLIEKAEDVCPGYFQDIMIEHIKEDSDFALLCQSLVSELAYMLLYRLKQKNEN